MTCGGLCAGFGPLAGRCRAVTQNFWCLDCSKARARALRIEEAIETLEVLARESGATWPAKPVVMLRLELQRLMEGERGKERAI